MNATATTSAPFVNRAARLIGVAHGGQVVMTRRTAELLGDATVTGTVLDLGSHRLRDLREIEHVFQLLVDGIPADFPPLRSLDRVRSQPADAAHRVHRARRAPNSTGCRHCSPSAGSSRCRRSAVRVRQDWHSRSSDVLGQPFDGVHFVDLGPIEQSRRWSAELSARPCGCPRGSAWQRSCDHAGSC